MLIHVARELAAISGDISDLALTLPHFYRYLRGVLTMDEPHDGYRAQVSVRLATRSPPTSASDLLELKNICPVLVLLL